jgi:hypothetical protein
VRDRLIVLRSPAHDCSGLSNRVRLMF